MPSAPKTAVATALLGVCAIIAPPAQARTSPPPRHLLARTTGPLLTDGARYAVYSSRPGRLTILDTSAKARRVIQLPLGCDATDGDRGYFLVLCTRDFVTTPSVLAARSGALLTVAGEGVSWQPEFDNFRSIGSHWIMGEHESDEPVVAYYNWRTGQVKYGEPAGYFPQVPVDLNSPDLDPLGPAADYQVFLAASPFTITQEPDVTSPLVLHRQGGRSRRLDLCRGSCHSVSAGGGWVTWGDVPGVRAYSLRGRRETTWRIEGRPEVAHTSNNIFFSVAVTDAGIVVGYHVYRARLSASPR